MNGILFVILILFVFGLLIAGSIGLYFLVKFLKNRPTKNVGPDSYALIDNKNNSTFYCFGSFAEAMSKQKPEDNNLARYEEILKYITVNSPNCYACNDSKVQKLDFSQEKCQQYWKGIMSQPGNNNCESLKNLFSQSIAGGYCKALS